MNLAQRDKMSGEGLGREMARKHTCPRCGNVEYQTVQITPEGIKRDITTCAKCDFHIGGGANLGEE